MELLLVSIVLIFILLSIIAIITSIHENIIRRKKLELFFAILDDLEIKKEDLQSYVLGDITVKSRSALLKYDEIKFFKDHPFKTFESTIEHLDKQLITRKKIDSFLKKNDYQTNKFYADISKKFEHASQDLLFCTIKISYITYAGNKLGNRIIKLSRNDITRLITHPELFMTKTEYNKVLKEENKKKLEEKKKEYYKKVDRILNSTNDIKESLIIEPQKQTLEDLSTKLFNMTIHNIQRIKDIDSEEWEVLKNFITNTEEDIKNITALNKKINNYYKSQDFKKIKDSCHTLISSQKEFNDYIDEKSKLIEKLFGTRIVRNETLNNDVFNYIRSYKKTITPFTAEVSPSVFSSAENNPIPYLIKFFYPDKSKYKDQIQKLKMLISELETLKEAKVIIDKNKSKYAKYIKNVPDYIIKNDENGFYSKLGFTIIDERVLNVEYKFIYTSGGGMAQRSFTIPMTEETIISLIEELENKLSLSTLAKEQRALMSSKLRSKIKERDNFSCQICKNSIKKEANLLLEVDHIVPIAKGGLTTEDNLQTLCWKCNRSKGAKLLEE